MSKPKPLSGDWLWWDPETIEHYPADPPVSELVVLDIVPTPVASPDRNRLKARAMARALLRDAAAGVLAGLVAALLLTLVIAFFPASVPADTAHESGYSADSPTAEQAFIPDIDCPRRELYQQHGSHSHTVVDQHQSRSGLRGLQRQLAGRNDQSWGATFVSLGVSTRHHSERWRRYHRD